MASLEAIAYERGRLRLLEQRRLPLESVFVDIDTVPQCWTAIRDMTVRGEASARMQGGRGLQLALAQAGPPGAGSKVASRASSAHRGQQCNRSPTAGASNPPPATRRPTARVTPPAGAPAIAISAALALAVDLVRGGSGAQFANPAAAVEHIRQQLDYLVTRWAGGLVGDARGMREMHVCASRAQA